MRTAWVALTAAAVAAAATISGTGAPAGAAEGTEDGIGQRKAYQFEERRINDRMTARVNVATGNLLLTEKDLSISGRGLSLDVSRHYNSLSTADGQMGPGWVMSIGHDVRLDVSDTSVLLRAPSGYQVRFTEDASGFTAEEPGLDAELRRRDGGGFVLEWRSKEKWYFDAAGKWTSQEDANGNTQTFAYETSVATGKKPGLTSVTDTRGRQVTFSYTKGRLTSMYDAAGGRTYSYGYDSTASRRMSSFALTAYGLGNDNVNRNAQTAFTYDTLDRLTAVTAPDGRSTRFGYSGTDRRVASMTQVLDGGAGPTTRFTYGQSLDACADESEAVAETVVDGPRTDVDDVTTYCVDKHDRVVATVDAKGHKAGRKYTSTSNVATLTESGVAGGPAYNFSFSQQGDNLTGVSLPTGGSASLDYEDTTNQHLPTSVQDFAAGPDAPPTWAYDYDANGNLIEARNVVEDVTYRYCYDGDGMLTRVAQPELDGLPLDEDVDADACSGHAQGNDTLIGYNAKGETTSIDPPGARRSETFSYDALSRVASRRDGRGVTQTFSYDALDRVVQVYYSQTTGGTTSLKEGPSFGPDVINVPPDGETTKQTWINYSYDASGNLVARSDAAGNSTFTYDALNRMTRESPEAPSAVMDYAYDPAGNVTSIETSDAPAPIRYTFDKTNLTASVTDVEGRTTTFEYDDRGNRVSTAYPNGVRMRARYDDGDRMTCTYAHTGADPAGDSCPAASTDLLTFAAYDYEAMLGGVATDTNRRESETARSGAETTYSYDGLGRLTTATTTGTDGVTTRKHEYSYDKRSNLTREVVSGSQATAETRSQAYDPDNALCWVATGAHASDCGAAPSGAETYSYDGAGGMVTGAGTQMSYSLRGHMVTVTPPGLQAVTMEYADATQDRRVLYDGLRMSYSQLGLTSQAPTNSSSDRVTFVRDPQQKLVGMVNADAAEADLFYLFDALGSVVATTDTTGAVVQRYEYEPYGEQIAPAAGDANPWRYASGYADTKTGMVKFGMRYYLPDVARWTQPDPVQGDLRNPVTINPYGYVGGDPVNYVDTSGRLLDEILEAYDVISTAQDVDSIFEGGVTWEEVGIFAASEGAGLLTETACMFAVGYFSGGAALPLAGAGCWAAGELVGRGVEEAMT